MEKNTTKIWVMIIRCVWFESIVKVVIAINIIRREIYVKISYKLIYNKRNYFFYFNKWISQLHNLEAKLEEDDQVISLLSSLHQSYDHIVAPSYIVKTLKVKRPTLFYN